MSFRDLMTWMVVLCICLRSAIASATDEVPVYSLREIHAYFYFEESGRVGDHDLFDPSLVLRNTPGGEGDASEPSTVTLITITVSGPHFGGGATGTIDLRASANGRLLSRQSVPLSLLFSRSQSVKVPFLVVGTGCEKLALKARILGVRAKPSEINKTVPFACGE